MTLPAAPPISWTQICAEFGLNPLTAVWPASFYGKGGAPTTGALSFQDFLGRSDVTFNPVPSDQTVSNHTTAASMTFTASQAVTWTWTTANGISANQAQGFVGTSITFTVGKLSQSSTTITATLHGNTYTWTLTGGG